MLPALLKKAGSGLIRIVFIYPVLLYQKLLSPHLGLLLRSSLFSLQPGLKFGCRFRPTCSQYYLQGIEEQGLFKGLGLFLKRLSRCW